MFSSRLSLYLVTIAAAAACSSTGETTKPVDAGPTHDAAPQVDGDSDPASLRVRVATFNASLFRREPGALARGLQGGESDQARDIAEIIQRVRPDVVLINEFDWDADGESAAIFATSYLAVGQGDQEPIDYPYHHVPETNTGVHSGVDLNNDGDVVETPGSQAYGEDAFGFGTFPGQYGMVLYSRFPIATDGVRSFRTLLWSEMPDNLMPTDWYSAAATAIFRLSSKNHVDIPVDVPVNGEEERLHFLASHPTPPGFDGDEDRNGRRNHDEIRLWSDYVSDASASAYIVDDDGAGGGLTAGTSFVVVGDLNSDPVDGDSRHGAIVELLEHPRVQDPQPSSDGAVEKSELDGQANTTHEGDAALDTADFSDGRVGNLRVDYVLPSSDLRVVDAGVFWPVSGADGSSLLDASDHRLVWVDVEL